MENDNHCSHILSEGELDSGETYTVAICRHFKNVEAITIVSSGFKHAIRMNHDATVVYGSENISLAQKDSVKLGDITIQWIAGKTFHANIEGSKVVAKFTPSENLWNIETSFAHIEKTTGLCGVCGGEPVETVEWEHHTFEDETCACTVKPPTDPCEPIIPTEGATCTGCDCLAHSIFSTCHAKVDFQPYMDACRAKFNSGANCNHCESLAAYAERCRSSGICLEWRADTTCAEECSIDMVHKTCGPCITKTCANYQNYDTIENVGLDCEGCYCPPGTVTHKGKCIPPTECPCCMDGENNFKVGDVWISAKDSCIRNTCSAGCSIKSEPVTCDLTAPPDVTCAEDEFKRLDGYVSAPCCKDKPKYVCDKCKPCNVCKELTTPVCSTCQKIKTIYSECDSDNHCACPIEHVCEFDEDYNPCEQDCPSCRPAALTLDTDGCPVFKCQDIVPECDPCCELVTKSIEADGCPVYTCSCPGECSPGLKQDIVDGCPICCPGCENQEEPDCGSGKSARSYVDSNGCIAWECLCLAKQELLSCPLGQELVDYTNDYGCPACKCQCLPCPPVLNCNATQDAHETIDECGCTTRTCYERGCAIELDFHDYIQPEDNWRSSEMIEVYMCSGECRSQSIWSDLNDKFNRQCSCCGVAETQDVEIELIHQETGEIKQHIMKRVTACGCTATKCAATEEQIVKIEEEVLEEVQKAGADIKAELKEELSKEEFETVREAVREDVRGLKAKITELFGF
jgi:hypothetical protein